MGKESVEELLKQAIAASDRTTAASDRTTRAIRAFVLFLFIQLTFTSIAAFFFWIGASIFETASIWDFQQRAWAYLWTALASIILFVGVLVSSILGWRELALSKVGLGEPGWIDLDYKVGPIQDKNYEPTFEVRRQYENYVPKKTKASENELDENSATRVCFKCERVYPSNVLQCTFCDLWLDPRLNFKT
jgi:hypothetical protein